MSTGIGPGGPVARETHECPNCAAPLRVPAEHERFVRCSHCGTVLEDVGDERVRLSRPVAAPPTGREITELRGPRRVGAAVAVIVALAVAGAVVPLAAGIVASSDTVGIDTIGLGGSALSSMAVAQLVASDDDTSPDVVVLGAPRGGEGAELVYVDEEADGGVRWRAPGPGGGSGIAAVAVSGPYVVASADDRLSVHNREQGAELWSASLPDDVWSASCDCVRIIGDVVAALSADATVTVHDAADGTLLWSRSLRSSSPTQLLDIDGAVGVVDETEEGAALLVLDARSGEQTRALQPFCQPAGSDERIEVATSTRLTELGDGTLLLAGARTGSGCAARWDPVAGAASWHAAVPIDFFSSSGLEDGEWLVHGESLVIGQEASATAVDLSTGAVTPLANEPDHVFHPVALADTVAVYAVQSTRGSGSWELRGIDVVTRNVRWVFEVAAANAVQFGSMTLTADDAFIAVPARSGVGVVQVDEELAIVTQVVPPGSGTATAPATVAFPSVIAGFVEVAGWHGDDVWLALDGRLVRFDVTDGSATTLL